MKRTKLIKALAIEVHTAGVKEVRRREKRNDCLDGLYERGSKRLIAAMEGIAQHIVDHYRPKE